MKRKALTLSPVAIKVVYNAGIEQYEHSKMYCTTQHEDLV